MPQPAIPRYDLFLSQIRALAVLSEGEPLLTKAKVAERIGLSPISGTLSRVFNGTPAGSSSGRPRPGLVTQGLLEKIDLEVDDEVEVVYRITERGRQVLARWIRENGPLPPLKDKEKATNTRYKGD